MASSFESAEDRLIARYFRPLASDAGAFGLIDDAAVVTPPPGCDVVLKTDGVIAGVHFFPDDPPQCIGRKALRMNLSDLAAKGAKPIGFLMSVALPKDLGEPWLSEFAQGLGEDARRYQIPLLGGDTDQTPGLLSVSISAFGIVPQGAMVRRSTANVGDCIVATGTIGDSALGVKFRRDATLGERWRLSQPMRAHLLQRYLLPEPRSALAGVVQRLASASIDVSDGLAGDLAKLCRASGVAAEVEVGKVPLSDAARGAVAAEPALIEAVLTGGDDYEIILTLPPERLRDLRAAAREVGVAVTEIGRVQAGEGVRLMLHGRAFEFTRPSYSHF